NGGLLRPFNEIAWSRPLYPIPNPVRSTILPLNLSGLQVAPTCGPKSNLFDLYSVPPSASDMPVSAFAPGPRTTALRLSFFSEIEPKYSQRRPNVSVRFDLIA